MGCASSHNVTVETKNEPNPVVDINDNNSEDMIQNGEEDFSKMETKIKQEQPNRKQKQNNESKSFNTKPIPAKFSGYVFFKIDF